MNNIILCEGTTDFALLQHYMGKVYGWKDGNRIDFKYKKEKARTLVRGESLLTIASVGGVSHIKTAFEDVLLRNEIASPSLTEAFNRIVIFTDHDEIDTVSSWKQEIRKIVIDKGYIESKEREFVFSYVDKSMTEREVEIILLIIPYKEIGALETFLLDCVSQKNSYDAEIIRRGNNYIDSVDTDNKYLSSRRLRVKAKFDVYFSVRTAEKQYGERADIMKGIEWEKYIDRNSAFSVLEKLD